MSGCMEASFNAIFSDPGRDRIKPYARHLGIIDDLIHQTCVEIVDKEGNDEALREARRRLQRARRLKGREIKEVPASSHRIDRGNKDEMSGLVIEAAIASQIFDFVFEHWLLP